MEMTVQRELSMKSEGISQSNFPFVRARYGGFIFPAVACTLRCMLHPANPARELPFRKCNFVKEKRVACKLNPHAALGNSTLQDFSWIDIIADGNSDDFIPICTSHVTISAKA